MSCIACQKYCTAGEIGKQYLDLDRLCEHFKCCRVTGTNHLFLEKGDHPDLTTDRICLVQNTALPVKSYTARHGEVMHKYVLPCDIANKNVAPSCYKLLRHVVMLPERSRRTYRHTRDKHLLICELPVFLGILRLKNKYLTSWAQKPPSQSVIRMLGLPVKEVINETESSH
jgi:hypothetical protein